MLLLFRNACNIPQLPSIIRLCNLWEMLSCCEERNRKKRKQKRKCDPITFSIFTNLLWGYRIEMKIDSQNNLASIEIFSSSNMPGKREVLKSRFVDKSKKYWRKGNWNFFFLINLRTRHELHRHWWE